MRDGKNRYIRHFKTITGIFHLTLWMLFVCSVISWAVLLSGIPDPMPDWLRAIIYDEDNKLSPLTYLIGLGGIISFLLSTVNKLSAKRTFGILLRDVVRFFFPSYEAIMFWFHGYFFVFGSYCCQKGFGFTAVFCLCGLILCSAYGLFMCVQLSEENLDRLVLSYMYWRCRKNAIQPVANKQIADNRKELHNFADYIHQQWQDNSALQLDRNGTPDLEGELIRGVMELMKPTLLPLHDWEGTVTLASGFKGYFQTSSGPFCESCNRGPCVCIPLLVVKECVAYQKLHDAVQECDMLWDRLLQTDGAYWQAKLAGKVFAAAIIHAPATFMPLACGLLSHLRLSGPSIVTKLEGHHGFYDYIVSRLDFLAAILDGYHACFPRGVEKPEINFTEMWGQVAYLAMAVLAWLDALQWPLDDGEAHRSTDQAAMMIKMLIHNQQFRRSLSQQADIYSYAAFILLSFERPEILKDSLTEYMPAYTSVQQKLCRVGTDRY